MATEDTTTTTDEEVIDSGVETEDNNSEDETTTTTTEQEDEGDTEDSENQDENEGDQDEENSDDDTQKFQKRFTQFKGETLEEYLSQVEDAYLATSKEGERIHLAQKELQGKYDTIVSIIAKDPEMAKKINEATGDNATPPTVDPALAYARDNMQKQMETDYNAFVDAHPELESDPQLRQEMLDVVTQFGAIAAQKGEVLSMADGLRKAWAYLGKDDNEEKVVSKAKEQAGKPKTQSTNKKSAPKTPQFTDDQLAVAKKMGVTPEQLAAAAKK